MVTYFGEDANIATPKIFFGTFWEFFEALERAAIENAQVVEKEKQAAQRAAQTEAMKKHYRPSPTRPGQAAAAPVVDGQSYSPLPSQRGKVSKPLTVRAAGRSDGRSDSDSDACVRAQTNRATLLTSSLPPSSLARPLSVRALRTTTRCLSRHARFPS